MPDEVAKDKADDESTSLMGGKLDPNKFKVDPLRVFRQMFGKEPEVDERTGELVYRPAGATDRTT